MAIPDPDTLVMDIDFETFESLVECLEENETWRMVSKKFSETFFMFSARDLKKIARDESPSHKLLSELHMRLCTVEILCDVLRRCQLFDILALLAEPEPLTIIRHPSSGENDTLYVPCNGELHLDCDAIGLPPPRYLWYHDNEELEGQTSNVLVIENFGPEQEGEYFCSISHGTNPIREVLTDHVKVKVHPEPPWISEQLPPQIVCPVGSEVVLEFKASGYPEVQYQWYRGNKLLDGETKDVIKISYVTLSDEGEYRCYIRNVSGEKFTRPCKLTVYEVVLPPSQTPPLGPDECVATVKVALLIANENYENLSKLNTPANDVVTLTQILQKAGFKVIALKDLTLTEMRNAVILFCSMLCRGAYGFVYFVGHGFEIQDKFMLPIDAPGPENYLRCHSLCEKEIIRDALETKPQLLVMLLDMCLKTPDNIENPEIYEEHPSVYAYKPERNLVIGYATTSSLAAYELESEENGIYMNHLKKFLVEDLPIENILRQVQASMAQEISDATDRQIPFLSINIVRKFCLSDDVVRGEETDEDIDEQYEMITDIPEKTELTFPRIQVVAEVTYYPFRNSFLNCLELHITNLEDWTVRCHTMATDVSFDYKRQDGKLMVFIHNLQKLKAPLHITVSLHDPKSDKLIDNCFLDLKYPLISSAALWCSPPDTTNLTYCSSATLYIYIICGFTVFVYNLGDEND